MVGFTPWNEEKHEEGGKEMPKRATLVVLSEEEQTALVQLTKRHKSGQQLVLRARIALAAGEG
jgi:hypothetical protein